MTSQPVPTTPTPRGCRRARAFTLIELLIVIGIITLLIVIGLAVGARVAGEGKRSATEQVIRVLDQTLTEYTAATGGPVPKMYTATIGSASYDLPLIDARRDAAGNYDLDADKPEPSLARYLALAAEVPTINEAIQGLDARFVREVELVRSGSDVVRGREVLDGWGRPIRFVHPAFQGGYGTFYGDSGAATSRAPLTVKNVKSGGSASDITYRRSFRPYDPASSSSGSVGDGDEGMCVGGRPYFYSAGEDGDPGTRADNVYSIKPQFPPETAKFGS